MSMNLYDLLGVGQELQFGADGLKINGNKVNGYFSILLADGVTFATLRVGDGVNEDDAVNLGQLNLKLDANKVVTDIDATAGYIADAPTVKAAIAAQIAALVNSAPATLDTIGEIATWVGEHQDLYEALLTTIGAISTKVDNLVTLSGMPANSASLGENTNGVTIPNNATVKQAVDALEYALEHQTAGCREIAITHNTSTTFDIGAFIPQGAKLRSVAIQVTTPWNAGTPVLEIGKTGSTAAYATSSLSNLKSAGYYEKRFIEELPSDTTIIGTINHGGSTAGGALIVIDFC